MTRFRRHHEFGRASFRIHISRFPWWTFCCSGGSKFSLDCSWLLRLVDLAIVMHGHFRGSRAIYTICKSGIPPIIQRHLPVLELVQQVIVCAIRALLVVHCICAHDLLDVSFPLHLTLIFLLIVVLFRLHVVIQHSCGNFVLHLDKPRVHSCSIHIVDEWLAGLPIEAYVVVGTILVLIVKEAALRHLLLKLAGFVHIHHHLLLVGVVVIFWVSLIHLLLLIGLCRIERHIWIVWLHLRLLKGSCCVYWNKHRVALALVAVYIIDSIWSCCSPPHDYLRGLARRVHGVVHALSLVYVLNIEAWIVLRYMAFLICRLWSYLLFSSE